ncbi:MULTISPECIES: serine/threonine-protein kinase [Streptomyces]|uniref:serine/threonine-protein kinase n=1 Tax=Streptomyces TaxID=1883 RepID=UPI0016773A5C|nr:MULTISPECIES: serine/threonine-protein kinase [Streptomyces]MBD3579220.1 serine/threonine protein kinase [Streptomyces sp. KD18]GGT03792.1 serine/threonine protein kinase [Streptomyces toxytricini]
MSGSVTAGIFQALEADDPPMVAGYRIAARLGAGGMGKVYLSHTPGGRAVAIKVIRPEFAEDAEFRRRFRREVLSAQQVQGLYTAPVIDSDVDGPMPWLATAYVPGPTVAAAVAEHGRLPTRTVLLLVAGIAEALQVIHGAGIVHRDLKPSNVLLASDGPRVIDFGIARAADATSLTASGVAIGTPSFMAPEQAADGEISGATDVFALGQVAAYAALGAPAYGEGPSHGVLYRIVHEQPNLNGLPAELRTLVSRCLVKDPMSRASLTEILDLCRAAADQTQLRRAEDWLPAELAAGITERQSVPDPVPASPALAPAPPRVPPATAPAMPSPVGAPLPPGPYETPPMDHRPQGYGPPNSYSPPQTVHPAASMPMAGYPPVPPITPPRSRATAALVSIFGGLLLLLACSGAAINVMSRGTDDRSTAGGADSGASASAKATPRPDPQPETYADIKLASDYHLKFGDTPLGPVQYSKDDIFYQCGFGSCDFATFSAKLARLDVGSSLQACRQETRFTTRIPVEAIGKGGRVCVTTDNGSIALITYKGSSPKGDPSTYAILDVTVWRGAARKD